MKLHHFKPKMGIRELKQTVLELIKDEGFDANLEKIRKLPERQVINPLFSFFFNTNELIKWRSITAVGAVVSQLADKDMESARVVMRRLLWNLNDESGGIGWGSPEAMGEIMAQHGRLAEEYAHLLVSYMDEKGSFIEHDKLQRGVLWGVGRLAHVRPSLISYAASFLPPYMRSEDEMHRGLAAWIAGAINAKTTKPLLRHLTIDHSKISIYIDLRLVERTVGQLSMEALSKL
ncbi:MAG: hypothetical protein JSW04_08720 [Desulfobacterales bacterium]|nr:MAG: hypothetical protein JSW04_08720 [Desulfobacterales bacterium]